MLLMDPNTVAVSAADHFWSKVDKTPADGSECWIWTAGKSNGYGWVYLPADQNRTRCITYAHRVSYEWLVGPIPPGRKVYHTCGTPACVRPDHLYILADKCRNIRKIPMNHIDQIRARFARGASKSALSRQYALSHRTITYIVKHHHP